MKTLNHSITYIHFKALLSTLVLAGLSVILACSAAAQVSYTWTGGVDNWATATNWTPSGDPNATNADIYVTSGANDVVNLSSDRTVGRITINESNKVAVSSSYFYLAGNGFAGAGVLTNDGLLQLTSSYFYLGNAPGQTINFTGTGTLALSNSTITTAAGNTNVSLVNNIAITGSGQIGGNYLNNIVNNGSITTASEGSLSLNPVSGGTFTNQGTVLAVSNSTIYFSMANGIYDNTAQTMTADGTSAQLQFNGGSRVIGGTLAGTNGGEVYLYSDNVVFDGVTFAGASRVSGGYYPTFTGGTTINGTMTASSGSLLRFGTTNNVTETLSGSGTLVLSNTTITTAAGNTNVSFVNNIAITGSGQIGGNYLNNIVNNGSITTASGGSLYLNPVSGGTFTNQGSVLAVSNSTIYFSMSGGIYDNTGQTMTADGTSAQLQFNGGSRVVGGTLAGTNGGEVYLYSDSVIFDGVTFAGTSRVADSYYPTFTGGTTINGTMTAGSGSLLRFGTTNNVTETLSGSGTLVLNNASITTASGNTNVSFVNNIAITGSGQIGGNYLNNIVNNGSITTASGGSLYLNPVSGGTFTNQGSVLAVSNSTIYFSMSGGIYDNTGQTMTADGTSAQLQFNGGSRVVGGTLAGTNGGEVYLNSDSVVFDSVTFAGTSRVANNMYPTFTGGTTINGTMTADSTSQIRFGTTNNVTETLSGSGSLVLSNATITTAYSGVHFVNQANIRGTGNFGNNTLVTIENQGSVLASGGGILNLNLSTSNSFTNNGTVGGDGGTFSINGDWTKVNNFVKDAYTIIPLDPSSWRGALVGGTWVATNSGSIVVTDTNTPRNYIIHGNSANVTLSGTNASITGFSGHVRVNETNGVIRVLNGQVFTPGAGGFTNSGLVQVGAGSEFQWGMINTTNGTISLDGTISGTVTSGGTVSGTGKVTSGDLEITAGTVTPGHSIGTLSVEGTGNDYVQTGGQIIFEIARLGGSPTQDRINALDSDIYVSDSDVVLTLLTGSEALQIGDTFTVLQANYLNVGDNLQLTNINYVFNPSLSGYTFTTLIGGDSLSFQVATVPEPSTVALLALSLSVAAIIHRRHRQS